MVIDNLLEKYSEKSDQYHAKIKPGTKSCH